MDGYGKDYSAHPDQGTVSRAFCAAKCTAWHPFDKAQGGGWCGTIYAPEYRKGRCLWTKEEVKVHGLRS